MFENNQNLKKFSNTTIGQDSFKHVINWAFPILNLKLD